MSVGALRNRRLLTVFEESCGKRNSHKALIFYQITQNLAMGNEVKTLDYVAYLPPPGVRGGGDCGEGGGAPSDCTDDAAAAAADVL